MPPQSANASLALGSVSQQLAATPAGGLARLAAGLEWLDAGRPQEALAQLTHPDIDKTLLRDHAFLATSRAYEALGQLAEAATAALAAADEPGSGVVCAALAEGGRAAGPRGAEGQSRSRHSSASRSAETRHLRRCSSSARSSSRAASARPPRPPSTVSTARIRSRRRRSKPVAHLAVLAGGAAAA